MVDTITTATRELDERQNNGLKVRLLWHVDINALSVCVDDSRTGDRFDVLVPDNVDALEVFHHPYAYVPHV